MNKSDRHIRESLVEELLDMQVFWSYNEPNINAISNDLLIEKVLFHSDLESIYKLFNLFPEDHIRTIWEQRLLPDVNLYSTNLLFAFLLFGIGSRG